MMIDPALYTGIAFKEHHAFWSKFFSKVEEATTVYEIMPPGSDESGSFKRIEHPLSASASDVFQKIVGDNPNNAYALSMSALCLLIAKYTGEIKVLLAADTLIAEGTQVNDRIFLNQTVTGDLSIRQLLKETGQSLVEAHLYEDYPMTLIEGVDAETIDTLTNVRFHFEAIHGPALTQKDQELVVSVTKANDAISWMVSFNNHYFTTEFTTQLLYHLDQVLIAFQDLDSKISTINVLSEEESKQITGLQSGKIQSWPHSNLVAYFEQCADLYADKLAVASEEGNLTYLELNQKANQLARFLQQDLNVKPNDRVGLMLRKSSAQIISMLGILKAQAAYVPIDPQYPEKRRDQMVNEADLTAMIIDSSDMMTLGTLDMPLFVADLQIDGLENETENLPEKPGAGHLAYVIFTSGSTGKPKGVAINHGNATNTISWSIDYYQFCPGNVRLQIPSFSFDSSVADIFSTLLSGSTLVLPAADKANDIVHLGQCIESYKVTSMLLVPSLYRLLLEESGKEILASLSQVIVAGELLTDEIIAKHFSTLPETRLYNEYGPTENSVCTTAHEIKPGDSGRIIGLPISNVQVAILDPFHQPLPPGTIGELVVTGAGLAQGYLNQKELTEKKFVVLDDTRYYFTGDLGRWLNDGTIEFFGRKDTQVKIRGFRIEIGEIEAILAAHEQVKEVVVAPTDESKATTLASFLVLHESIEMEELKQCLTDALPDHMIPAHFIQVDQLPRTPTGKVDRKELTLLLGAQEDKTYVAPRNEAEAKIAKMCEAVLELERVSIEDDFFAIGGHSLNATQLVSRIHRSFDVKLELREVFEHSTVEKLAAFVQEQNPEPFKGITLVTPAQYYDVSHAQKRLWILDKFEKNAAYNIPGAYQLRGALNEDALKGAFEKLIERHEILRTTFTEIDEIPKQVVHEPGSLYFKSSDISDRDNVEALAYEMATDEGMQPFDLENGPLLRTHLIRLAKDHYLFLLTMHHIVADAWSMVILVNDLMTYYNNLILGEEVVVEVLPIQYKDYSAWQNNLLETDGSNEHRDYWLSCFEGEIPVLNLPTDRPRPKIRPTTGEVFSFRLDRELKARIDTVCQDQKVSLFMVLMSGLKALLYRYTSQEDIIIGSPVAGRDHFDLENQIGFYVNTLAIRTKFKGSEGFDQLLEKVRDVTTKAYEHQMYPFDRLIDDLQLERDTSRTPLFDVNLVLQNADVKGIDDVGTGQRMTGIEIDNFRKEFKTNRFDLLFNCSEVEEEIHIHLEYNDQLFNRDRIERLTKHFQNLMSSALSDTTVALMELPYLEMAEQESLQQFGVSDPLVETAFEGIHEVIDRHAVTLADEQAVAFEGKVALTYEELKIKSDQLAGFILAQGMTSGSVVALLMEPTPEAIVSMLGVLKTGLTYLPMDPAMPMDRLRKTLDSSEAPLLLTLKSHLKTANRLQWECKALSSYLCLDTEDVYEERESGNELMNLDLWDYVGDQAFDTISGGGWMSSYTGAYFSQKEMDEYAVNIFQKAEPFLTPETRVLEIGCASGITMFQVAPRVARYYGTDLSQKILNFTEKEVAERGITNVALGQYAAHNIDQLPEGDFDLIIINSVIQSFEGHNYLREVLRKVIDKMSDKGVILLGDIMDLDLKQEMIQSFMEFKQQDEHGEWNTKIDWSNELFLSRDFLNDLPYDFPEIQTVVHSGKSGTVENELTKFRFDSVLEINKQNQIGNHTDQRSRSQFGWDQVVASSKNETKPISIDPASRAYVIYTSGTTGAPKGVQVTHGGLTNYLRWANAYYFDDDRSGNMPFFTSCAFDLTVTSIFLPLLRGKTVFVHNEEDPAVRLEHIFANLAIDTVKLTPTHVALLNNLPSLFYCAVQRAILGGEKVASNHIEILQTFNPEMNIFNEYGPTEGTVACTVSRVNNQYWDIGRPIDHTQVYLVDNELSLVPIGSEGELCIGGMGLAAGYLHDPELTAEKFVPNPFTNEGFLYRTGDLAKWRSDGQIELLGRRDDQVKIRGNRIELQDIEGALTEYPLVVEAFVNTQKDPSGDQALVAYYQSNKEIEEDLQGFLATRLPAYMVPAHYVHVTSFPLTQNGKVKQEALPDPWKLRLEDENYVAPRTEIESKVAEIWGDVLGSERISIDANFFKIGGHSLRATQVLSRLQQFFQVEVDLSYLFNNPTIEALAKEIEARKWAIESKKEQEMDLGPNVEEIRL